MAFTVPQFNTLCDIWFCGNTPAEGDPDFENQECQLYIYSRAPGSIVAVGRVLWIPDVWLRLPSAASSNWASAFIVESPPETGRYYLCRWKDVMHQDFPNQYRVILLEQCDENGDPIFRDVCPSLSPTSHEAFGVGDVGVTLTSNAVAIRNPSGESHHADATGEIEADLTGAGEASKGVEAHHAIGTGEITADLTSEATAHRS